MAGREVAVWDLPVRLFHWALVALMAFSWWSGKVGGLTLEYHMWSGYGVLTLLLFRIAWGFAGSEHARFASFLRGPRLVFASLRELLTPAPLRYPGHNPLGGWMVAVMLVAVLLQAGSGLFANDDLLNEGPLYRHVGKDMSDRLTDLHHLNFSVLLVLIAIHVGAVAYHRLRKGERLVAAMISGRKWVAAAVAPPRMVGLRRALLLLGASAFIVAAIVNFP